MATDFERRLAAQLFEFYRCPNSGLVIQASKGYDDKVICGCGKKNPHPQVKEESVDPSGGVHHFKAFLEYATPEDWFKQTDGD